MKNELGKLQRLFVAVFLPDKIRSELRKAQEELIRIFPQSSVRWSPPDQFHLTLKFLGEVNSEQTPALKNELARVAEASPALELRAAGLGFFPESGPPRVIWAGVSDAREPGALARLAAKVELEVGGGPLQKSGDAYVGHVTLGRARDRKMPPTEKAAQLAAGMASRVFGIWTASEIHLVESMLSPSGARHETLCSVRLGAP